MTIEALRLQAAQLKRKRAQVDVDAAELLVSLGILLGPGDAKRFAATIGVTQQYLSDIRNGRRAVSDEFLERLVKL